MQPTPPMLVSTVVYAKDIQRVAEFYKRTLALSVLEGEPGFIVLGNDDIEIAIVKIPTAIAQSIQIEMPPRTREETPVKCSYLVSDFDLVRAEALATVGSMKPVETAWHWRGQLHLDGCDPEGNVVQFRTRNS